MTPQFKEIVLDLDHSRFIEDNGVQVPLLPVYAQAGQYIFYLKFNSVGFDICMIPPMGALKSAKAIRVPAFPYTLSVGESITKLRLVIAKRLFGVLTEKLGETENLLYITTPDIREINNKEPVRIYVVALSLVKA